MTVERALGIAISVLVFIGLLVLILWFVEEKL